MINTKRTFSFILLPAILLSFAYSYYLTFNGCTNSLEVEMSSNVYAVAQLYYDKGEGFNETDSSSNTIVGDGIFHRYFFKLPEKTYFLRFDPLNTDGKFEIKNMSIKNDLHLWETEIELSKIVPFNQIKTLIRQNDILVAETTHTANDPMLHIKLQYPFVNKSLPFNFLLRWVYAFIILVIIISLLKIIWINTKPKNREFFIRTSLLVATFFICLVFCELILHLHKTATSSSNLNEKLLDYPDSWRKKKVLVRVAF